MKTQMKLVSSSIYSCIYLSEILSNIEEIFSMIF